MPDWISLHGHSQHSLLDGMSKLPELVEQAKNLGMSALALTDHGNMHAAMAFSSAAAEKGIKAIIGVELYVTPGDHRDHTGGQRPYHLTALARTEEGFHNLHKLVSAAHLYGQYYNPRVDHRLLSEHAAGLTLLSGCLSSEVSKAICANDLDLARSLAREYQAMVGPEHYYFEVMRHPGLELQDQLNEALFGLSSEMGIPLVATNDSHYTFPDEALPHEILLCVGKDNTDWNDPKRFRLEGEGYHLRSPEEMTALFRIRPEAIENSLRIAESCTFVMPHGKSILPEFTTPTGEAPDAYLRRVVLGAMEERYSPVSDSVRQRVEYELDVIVEKGYATYMLIVADYVNWAKRQDIAVGPGRGSAAGSVVSYLLKITGVDPFYYKLPFERFLNRERPSGPDIDVDFSDKRRDEVLAYVAWRYGQDRVSRICTFGTMGARGSIKDVGRVLGIDKHLVDRVANLIPKKPKAMSIDEALTAVPELAALIEGDRANPDAQQLLRMARPLEGTARHVSTHACGVIIGDRPLMESIPLMRNPGAEIPANLDRAPSPPPAPAPTEDGAVLCRDLFGELRPFPTTAVSESTTEAETAGSNALPPLERAHQSPPPGMEISLMSQYPYNDVEHTGLLKMDFLGLINLSMIEDTIAAVARGRGLTIDLDAIPLDDPKTFDLFSTGNTTGVFQMESAGMRRYVQQLKPTTIFDIAAMVALFRPVRMQTLPAFIARKHDPSFVSYLDPRLESILSDSLWLSFCTYQDDVLSNRRGTWPATHGRRQMACARRWGRRFRPRWKSSASSSSPVSLRTVVNSR